MLKHRFHRGCRGLTLVELLVALFLLGLLALLSMSALQVVNRRVKSAQLQRNLRNAGAAVFSYTAEHNGRLPSGAVGPLHNAGELSSQLGSAVAFWFNALDYYLGGRDHTLEGMRAGERPAWQVDPLKVYGADSPRRYNGYGIAVGLGWNHQHFGYDAQSSNLSFGWSSRLSEVTAPARTIIIGTGEDSDNAGNPIRNLMIYANSIRCRRHAGGGYYLFLDGHVERLTPEEVMADDSALMKKRK